MPAAACRLTTLAGSPTESARAGQRRISRVPYAVRKLPNGQWAAVKKADGKVMGRHASEKKAKAQVAAIYANEKSAGWCF